LIAYTYDVNNQRISKNVNGVVERYVLDQNQIALVFDGQGVQKSRYLYGNQVDQVLAEETGTSVRWFLADEQGTIKDVVDNVGTAIDHIAYDSFGRIVNQTSAIDLRFAYTGREWDGEAGQYYYRARYYDPMIGRFISEDPLGFGGGDTNIYRYVDNSSTNHTDPSGLKCDCKKGFFEQLGARLRNAAVGSLTGAAGGATTGAIAGGVVGSFAGGVGAAPGAVTGAGAGAVEGAIQGGISGLLEDPCASLQDVALNGGLNGGLGGLGKGYSAAKAAAARAAAKEAEALAAAAKRVCCFVAGTLIQTIDGEKAIEDIKIGDWVLSDDPNTPGGIEYKQVLQTFNHDTTNLVDIFINGEKITTTDTHPFWVQDVGWVAARDLNAGTHLQTKTESWLAIDVALGGAGQRVLEFDLQTNFDGSDLAVLPTIGWLSTWLMPMACLCRSMVKDPPIYRCLLMVSRELRLSLVWYSLMAAM
jgi:RHS repeat-associated protein